ncbi:hypothetical protein PFBG_05637 [Plasmodium falciparum 7G8]|uniref:Uncharacterized protein n=3 Tax=Plasmodium falciparum TaxID=5833 RepID=A0A024WH68_PLAFA|nr:hypothetical protein PFNF135_05707 [Plasmodium falciparum NF135/5.C10]ETW46507.1 hypothetical protein PFMALIP_05411 [Plasmodium falciparum MaliPS096_E11]EUR62426.1 hypothetical protein PFBG_05637 [Plasmodium falciparum 7G8]
MSSDIFVNNKMYNKFIIFYFPTIFLSIFISIKNQKLKTKNEKKEKQISIT